MDSKSPHTSGVAADKSPMLNSHTTTTSGHGNIDPNNHLMTGTLPPSNDLSIATFERDSSEIVRMARQSQLTQVQQEQMRHLFMLASNIVNAQGYSKVFADQLCLKEKVEEIQNELDATKKKLNDTKKNLAATGYELSVFRRQRRDMLTIRRR
ncbi:hypothetical protein CcaCcLH18_05036 [Colletotrichum camelliae]|nr:hypothetical protein CcaCcLH18_05036 [Colletotrichum camelliae]